VKQTTLLHLRGRITILALSKGISLAGFSCICAILAIAMGLGAARTIVLEAQTTGLQITFSGQANDWALGSAVICTPREKIDPLLERGAGTCDARRYIERNEENLRINWNREATVVVTALSPGTLTLDVSGQSGIVDRTRILLDRSSWASVGALTFFGTTQVGFQLASGESKMLLSGSFEIRERPLWSDSTEVLKSGLIRRGESAAIVQQANGEIKMAEVFGHITPSLTDRLGVTVGVVSSPAPVSLQIGFFGATVPAQITPNWMDRALTSPLILAIAALLSILLSALQIFSNFGTALLGRAGPKQKESNQDSNEPNRVAENILTQPDVGIVQTSSPSEP
jgi:hypothetical protein